MTDKPRRLVSTRIDPEDDDLLHALAERTDRSKAWWIRRAVVLMLTSPEVLGTLGLNQDDDNGNVTPLDLSGR